jgi:hypothetical protein
LEKLAMEEITAEYLNYSTMASEEHLIKCRDAVEEIIAKYMNYSTMASVETPVKQPTDHQSPAHSKFKKIAVKQPTAHSSTAHSSPAHSSPAKQPPVKFNMLTIAQVLAKLRLHREDTHGQHEPAAGGGDKKVHPYDKPRPEDQQVLEPKAQQILAPVDSTYAVRADSTSTMRADITSVVRTDNTSTDSPAHQDHEA